MGLNDKYPGCYFRRCSEEEIISMFTIGELFPKNYGFISLSKSDHIPSANSSPYIVVYDSNIIYEQGGIEIKYDVEFLKNHPKILKHISTEWIATDDNGFEYYPGGFILGDPDKWVDEYSYETLKAFNLPMSTSLDEYWDFLCGDVAMSRRVEEEVVIEHIKLEPGLVIDVLWASDELSITATDDSMIFDTILNYVRSQN